MNEIPSAGKSSDDVVDTLSAQVINVPNGMTPLTWHISLPAQIFRHHGRFVRTTWHEDGPFEEVVHFFRCCTAFDSFTPHHYLTVIFGGDEKMREAVSSALQIGFVSQG